MIALVAAQVQLLQPEHDDRERPPGTVGVHLDASEESRRRERARVQPRPGAQRALATQVAACRVAVELADDFGHGVFIVVLSVLRKLV